MVQSKIETFTAMLAEQPENAMIWYGLASEQYKLENWAEAAESFRQVVSLNQDYTAAYQMLGTVLAKTDDLAGARQAWRDGIEAAGRTGAWKAGQHMQALLAARCAGTRRPMRTARAVAPVSSAPHGARPVQRGHPLP